MATPHPGPASALVFEGRCWKFGGKIPTDAMAEFFARDVRHVLADQNARFPLEVRPGDIVVAGVHFGQSSGRALAAMALQATGIGGVVAESAPAPSATALRSACRCWNALACPGWSPTGTAWPSTSTAAWSATSRRAGRRGPNHLTRSSGRC